MTRKFAPPKANLPNWYERFNLPVTNLDCGIQCAPYNPSGKPFCCDICHAVPAAYRDEWDFLQPRTDLWHVYRGDECPAEPGTADPQAEVPNNMILLACLGPAQCQRNYRAISCRQFPFFPYITSDFRFLGLAYEWHFESTCWVISHLDQVTDGYRREFIQFYDDLFSLWMHEMENYSRLSEEMREHFIKQRRRIPLLHRNGGYYLISPASERAERVASARLPEFGPYKLS